MDVAAHARPAEAGTPTENIHAWTMECSWVEVPPSGMAMDAAAHAGPAEAGTPAEKTAENAPEA